MGLDMYLKNSKGEQVAYWRKANQIRGWLVDHGVIQEDDDQEERLFPKEKMAELVEDCKSVLADHKLAEELIPTTSGFFFGSEQYGDWYFEDLKATVDKLEPLLKTDETYIYHDWW